MQTLDALIARTRDYVEEVLGTPLDLVPSDLGDKLPFFLRDRFAFYDGQLLDRRCLFAAPKSDLDDLEAPASLAKQVEQIASRTDAIVVLLLPVLAAYNRKRLIAHRINFIVARTQLFLPQLAVDLRDSCRPGIKLPAPPGKPLSPTAQMIVIDALLGDRLLGRIAKDIAQTLRVSAMAVGRALDELRATDFAALETQGQSHRLYFNVQGRALWDAARPLMSSPVRKVRSVTLAPSDDALLSAGELALAHYTSLGFPPRDTYAIHDKDWKRLFGDDPDVYDEWVPTPVRIETWSYPPAPLSRDGRTVDPLSLYLAIQPNDERVEIAADELLEKVFG